MTIDLYYMPLSPPCRSIQMLAKTLGIELNLKVVDLFAGEHLKPDFLKVSKSPFNSLCGSELRANCQFSY